MKKKTKGRLVTNQLWRGFPFTTLSFLFIPHKNHYPLYFLTISFLTRMQLWNQAEVALGHPSSTTVNPIIYTNVFVTNGSTIFNHTERRFFPYFCTLGKETLHLLLRLLPKVWYIVSKFFILCRSLVNVSVSSSIFRTKIFLDWRMKMFWPELFRVFNPFPIS